MGIVGVFCIAVAIGCSAGVVGGQDGGTDAGDVPDAGADDGSDGGTGLPDLVVSQLTLSPANPEAGQQVLFSATVVNQGNAATPLGELIGVLFSVDGQPATWVTNGAALAPGASITLLASGGPQGSATWSAIAGAHTVTAYVNDANRFPESDVGNNILQLSFSISDDTVPACTKTVAKDGSGDFATIQAAADAAVAGDTVCVEAGTYNERVVVSNSGNAGQWIIYTAAPGAARDTVIIDGTGIQLMINDGLVHIEHKSYILFSGFRVQNSSGGGIHVSARDSPVPFSHVTIENNHTYNTDGGGIIGYGPGNNLIINRNEVEMASGAKGTRWPSEQVSLSGNIDGFVFSNNEVHHNGQNYTDNWRGGEGPTFKDGVSNGRIFGNHLHHMKRTADIDGQPTGQTSGMYSDGFVNGVTNIDIYNNIVHDITGFGIAINSEETGINESTTVRNNLVYNNSRWGIILSSGGDDISTGYVKNTIIVNNTIYGNGERGICVIRDGELAPGLIIRNNISANNGQSQFDIRNDTAVVDTNLAFGPSGCEGTNCIEADPEFVDPAAFDFHLKPSSRARNAGSPTDAPSFDFANGPRPWPVGGEFDIGAYEFDSPPGL